MEKRIWPDRPLAVVTGVAICTAAGILLASCQSRSRLIEQCDNGPAGGPPGASEGYFWVHPGDHPSAGKNWRDVDPKTLTPEQKSRIGSFGWP